MRRLALLSLGVSGALLGCETFIALGDDYTEQCAALTTVYRDADRDGEGTKHEPLVWCGDPPPEYVTNTFDCNDENAEMNTRAPDDQCDGIDQDCDEDTDDDFPTLDCSIGTTEVATCQGRTRCVGAAVLCFALYYFDQDEDGYGSTPNLAAEPEVCAPPADGGAWVEKGGDCDDGASTIHPGAEERCNDVVDQNCNGTLGWVYLRQTFTNDVLGSSAPGAGWFSGTNSGFVQGAPSGEACNRPEDDATPTEDGNLVGVGLGACVAPGTSGELESPAVDTTGALKLLLVFQEWVDFTPEATTGVPPSVTISAQQGTERATVYSVVKPGPMEMEPVPGWYERTVPVGTFTGPSTSFVWTYESGDAVGWGGYGIDDVALVDERCVE